MSKPNKKNVSNWVYCEKCEATITTKDMPIHETNCPPWSKPWNHNYIYGGVLHSIVETSVREQLNNISERKTNDMVFMAPSTMEMCQISIEEPVVIETEKTAIVRTAWPTHEKTLTTVSLTKKTMETTQIDRLVKVTKLPPDVYIARVIEISHTGKLPLPEVTPELEVYIKNYHERSIFLIGNRVSVPYYGKNLTFEIKTIKADKNDTNTSENDLSESMKIETSKEEKPNRKFYKAFYNTQWKILLKNEKTETENTLIESNLTIDDLGGYEKVIEDLRDVMDVALGKWKKIDGFNVPRGIFIYGTVGVGKSAIANAVISEYKDIKLFVINSWDIQEKTMDHIMNIFQNCMLQSPSILLIENIDNLCPRKNNANQQNGDKRVLSALLKFLDNLRLSEAHVVVLATTSKPEHVDVSLRRAGRLDRDFEICAPTPRMRNDILKKIMKKMSHCIKDEEIEQIAYTTHGFVASDLCSLCSDAAMNAMKRYRSYHLANYDIHFENDIKINVHDLSNAMRNAKPSAMKEVIVEVPNVKWTEIGGQKSLKLKLKQAVEWPLTNPEAFSRLGITPPRGLLMFGPPGCSKTMIAKALATESKLNFFNIKGPELFSKWVGESEKAVREIFRKARQVAPSIIFIDEIDALGSERGTSSHSGGSNVQERVLAQLLTELDGVTALGNVTLVAATNRPDRIDKALLRPGRLDRIVYVPLPDAETRNEIFSIKFRKMPVADDVNIVDLVDLSEGYSGAEVQAICHEAAMKALEENLDAHTITKEHFRAAFSIVTPRTPKSLIQLYDDYINNYK